MHGLRTMAGLLMLGVTGCQNLPLEPVPPPTPPPRPAPRLLQPLDGQVGRVQTVNERLRFVVLDFSLSRLPSAGDRLELLRDGVVVGELKVTGPFQGTSTAADIVEGDPIPGDEVRPRIRLESPEP